MTTPPDTQAGQGDPMQARIADAIEDLYGTSKVTREELIETIEEAMGDDLATLRQRAEIAEGEAKAWERKADQAEPVVLAAGTWWSLRGVSGPDARRDFAIASDRLSEAVGNFNLAEKKRIEAYIAAAEAATKANTKEKA